MTPRLPDKATGFTTQRYEVDFLPLAVLVTIANVAIHIDRSQKTQAFNKVVAQGRKLLEQGIWIIMFPEGTRIPRGQKGNYKNGGSRLACETGVPVVPIAVTSAKVWPRKAFIKRPGVVDVSIGPAISSVGRKPDELMREVEAWIEAEMRRLDPEAYAPAAAAASTAA